MTDLVISIGAKEVLGLLFSQIGIIAAFMWFLASRFSKIEARLDTIDIRFARIEDKIFS